jgi:hypothetical protein
MGRPGSSRGADYMKGFTWEGTHGKSLMEELNMELSQIKNGSVKGLVMAAAFIRNKTESESPLTPVDTGNLRASWFVVSATGINAGRGNPKFKGTAAGKRQTEHSSVVPQAQGEVKAMSNANQQFVMLGYTASYSGWVHEMIGARNMSRSGSGPKWLESAIKNNKNKIVEIVRDNAKVK